MSTQRKRIDDNDNEEEEEFDETPTPKKSKVAVESVSTKPVFQLGAKKKVSISEFRGTLLVDIREYYSDKNDGADKVRRVPYQSCVISSRRSRGRKASR